MRVAAQYDERSESYLPTGTEGGTALRQLAAERLAAHRNRKAIVEGREARIRREQAVTQAAVRLQARRDATRADLHPDASRVRETVAARYQQSVSYREFLAAEAQRALEQAQAEAEVAARNAVAVASAQRQLLAEIEQWNQQELAASERELFEESPVLEIVEPRVQPAEVKRTKKIVREEATEFRPSPLPAILQVRLPGEIELSSTAATSYVPTKVVHGADDELAELEEEIRFRLAPEFTNLVMETTPIQANIIEFPRQLVASRKARPRLAEGPLREDGTPEPQLRIFEVEPEQISVEPETAAASAAPEWQGLLLGSATWSEAGREAMPHMPAQLQMEQQIFAASIGRRLMSVAVDLLCLTAGLAGFAAVAMKISGESLRGTPLPLLAAAAVGTLVFFVVLYQMLFFTLNEATPGMRAMRLAFCTFSESNPTRKAMRLRLLSTALAACPLGLGLLWTALDSDRLGWHDRMSRMYPRNY
jgi:uncharacterized RDD family membrane protein YckC